MFEASGMCSEAGWRFIGLSIAEWSLIAFTGMSIAMLIAILRKT
jgi:disulfide bond formation protein DsbB